jgi:hypothetical protein
MQRNSTSQKHVEALAKEWRPTGHRVLPGFCPLLLGLLLRVSVTPLHLFSPYTPTEHLHWPPAAPVARCSNHEARLVWGLATVETKNPEITP